MKLNHSVAFKTTLLAVLFFWASACNGNSGTQSASGSDPAEILAPTAAPSMEPTPTSLPLAASVNGEGILLSDFNEELLRLQDAQLALKTENTLEEQKKQALDELINQTLLAQAAVKNGFTIDESALLQRINDLSIQMGGEQAFLEWQNSHHYSAESFQRVFKCSIAATWQRDFLINSIPVTAEQVLARQVLVFNEYTANQIYQQLQGGADFASIAFQYDPLTGGSLGWFPRSYLTQPAIEEAAFALQPNEFSPVIQSDLGYHIIQVINRDNEHPLSPDALSKLQHASLQSWLQQQRAEATVNYYLP